MQEAVSSANLATRFLEGQRNEEKFNAFYIQVVSESKELTSEPVLTRYRQPQKRFGGAPVCTYDNLKSYFKKLYYEAFDLTCGELKSFPTNSWYTHCCSHRENIDTANHHDYNLTIPKEVDVYAQQLDLQQLKIQLQMLPELIRRAHSTHLWEPSQFKNSMWNHVFCEQ